MVASSGYGQKSNFQQSTGHSSFFNLNIQSKPRFASLNKGSLNQTNNNSFFSKFQKNPTSTFYKNSTTSSTFPNFQNNQMNNNSSILKQNNTSFFGKMSQNVNMQSTANTSNNNNSNSYFNMNKTNPSSFFNNQSTMNSFFQKTGPQSNTSSFFKSTPSFPNSTEMTNNGFFQNQQNNKSFFNNNATNSFFNKQVNINGQSNSFFNTNNGKPMVNKMNNTAFPPSIVSNNFLQNQNIKPNIQPIVMSFISGILAGANQKQNSSQEIPQIDKMDKHTQNTVKLLKQFRNEGNINLKLSNMKHQKDTKFFYNRLRSRSPSNMDKLIRNLNASVDSIKSRKSTESGNSKFLVNFPRKKKNSKKSTENKSNKIREQKKNKNFCPQSLLPISTRQEYKLTPSMSKIYRMTKDHLQKVEDFCIQNKYGKIVWPGETDILELNFDLLIEISLHRAEVYASRIFKTESCRHVVGTKLNKLAVVTLNYVEFPEDFKDGELFLKDLAEKQKSRHIGYDCEKKQWTFEVDHFEIDEGKKD